MAQSVIQIKRSLGNATPGLLRPGEFAYSSAETGATGTTAGVLYIGGPSANSQGFATTNYVIGGTKYTSLLDVEAGKLTAGKTIVVDKDGGVDTIHGVKNTDTGETKLVIGLPDTENQKVVIHDPYVKNKTGEIIKLDQFIDQFVKDGVITLVAGDGIANITNQNGTYTIALEPTGAQAGIYGSETKVPSFTINQYGQITNIEEKTISTKMNVEDATGDVAGNVDLISGKLTIEDGLKLDVATLGTAKVAVDETVVRTAGDQTIAGAKTFTTAPKINTETVTTKEYVDGQFVEKVTNEIGKSLQAHHKQLDTFSAFEEQGLVHRSTEGAFKGITVSGEKGVDVTLDPVGGTLKVGLTDGGKAGTFFKVTTDAQGRVTKGENPTKVDEFGIVDAVHKTGDTMSGVLKYAGTVDESMFDANTLITKKYADNVALGFVFHDACRAGATENVEGTYQDGSQPGKPGVGATFTTSVKTFGGVTVKQNDRVLLVAQTDAKQNGAYTVTSIADQATLTRAHDFDGDPAISFNGASFLIAEGDNKGQVWRLSNIGTLIFGTTELEFVQIFAPTQLIAGDGISVNGATISVAQGNTVKVIGSKLEVASGDDNSGKVLFAGANGTAASWKEFTIDDIASGVLPIIKGGTGHANNDEKVMQVGAIKLKTASTSDVFVPATGTLVTLAGSEVLTNKTVKAEEAGQTALAVQNGDIVGEAYGEDNKAPELKGFIIDCGTY